MTFYTYDYLHQSQSNWQYGRIAVLSVLAVIFILFLIHYLRNRMDIKYKDLSIIVATLLLLVLALQYNDFNSIQSSSKQTGQITQTVKQVANRLHVQPKTISVNSTNVNANLMVKTPRGYFRVDYNSDGSAFVLEKVELDGASKIKVEEAQ
ncbi:DUF3290 domain-containing protein [Lentilactobacillus kefiri]|uniref:DUF3290 domain-containing protein n=2 Tax=Lentilactobacillus kefiri TaxID=33962 RepID=A0A8E1V1G8_LENKE|nr:DUF3290 domain-containing protein [Lentilactobacillus kefiri]KRL73691.1 hypothetical protein FD08_GL002313 [Lentilactobacillus parakefiri DSM 10551]KRM49795.1 hypothetical protein FC95_GL000207 [Lentilactobacillus kefiri DSM 20587 = JCM 5818]MCJ2161563.1 DUF3290 domain-containing protein [Lentilactobacillus kefiri]MCP9368152.1 DUF3290 domain-containing protein [Lentilactobacillus kefiri]MDH5108218.1 DUF3290 domain-containing protein [Lentilactobacillus kefiri]